MKLELLMAFICLLPLCQGAAVKNQTQKHTLQESESSKISPENDIKGMPDLSEMVEIKEEDIPEGALVMMVEEHLQEHKDGELMDVASNVVFRPLFRYREKQTQKIANRRIRRRYYVPRRSYRGAYYRPYRSVNRRYYRPYRYF